MLVFAEIPISEVLEIFTFSPYLSETINFRFSRWNNNFYNLFLLAAISPDILIPELRPSRNLIGRCFPFIFSDISMCAGILIARFLATLSRKKLKIRLGLSAQYSKLLIKLRMNDAIMENEYTYQDLCIFLESYAGSRVF